MHKGRYLGLDYGDRRTGVAISDVDKQMVFPRDAIISDSDADLLGTLKTLCAAEGVSKVIVGLPIQMDGQFGERALKTYAFADQLRKALGPETPVELFDERLTTRASQNLLHQGGIKAKAQKKLKDSVSAQLILESYLKKA